MSKFQRVGQGAAQASQMYNQYLAVHKRGAKGLNLKDWGRILGWVCLVGSLVFWIPMEWRMASPIRDVVDAMIAVTFGVYVAIGPSVIISVFLPGTRAGNLLLKLNISTPGKIVALGAGLFLIYHAARLMFFWWLGRVAGQSGMAYEYAILGVIFTIVSPALLFEPQSEAELEENLAQEHATQVYEQAAMARVNLMMKARLNAEGLMNKGLENLTGRETAIVARYMRGFTAAVDQRHLEQQRLIKETSGVVIPYAPLGADPRVAAMFGFLDNLADVQAIDVAATRNVIEDHTTRQIDGGRPRDGRVQPLPQPVAVEPQPVRVIAPPPPAVEPAAAAARSGPPEESEAEGLSEDLSEERSGGSWDAYGLAYQALASEQPIIRADIERVMKCKRSKAGALLADWKYRDWIVEVDSVNHRYAFAIDVERTAKGKGETP